MRLVLRTLRRITRHGVEAPAERAALAVVGRNVAAHSCEIRAAVADHHEVSRKLGRTGDGVGLALVPADQGVDFPHEPAGTRIDGMQPAIEGTDVQQKRRRPIWRRRRGCAWRGRSFERGESAVDGITARVARPAAVAVRVVGPEFLAGRRIERIDASEVAGRVHHTVDDQGRRLLAAVGAEPIVPGETQLADVAGIDVLERGIIRAVGVPSRREPLIGVRGGEPRGSHIRRLGRRTLSRARHGRAAGPRPPRAPRAPRPAAMRRTARTRRRQGASRRRAPSPSSAISVFSSPVLSSLDHFRAEG